MEIFQFPNMFSCLLLPFLFHFSTLFFFSAAQDYTLPDRYFINCGSSSSPTVYGRTFTGDQSTASLSLSSGESIRDENPSSSTVEIYETARILRKVSRYELHISENALHVVRLHFFPFPSLGNLSDARFNVSASGFSLLSNFLIQNGNFPIIEEFLVRIPPGKFMVSFAPYGEKSFAFVNAMEIFPAPPNFIIASPAPSHITPNGFQGHYNDLLSPLRLIHRINVGGDYVMPNNDTLLRNWIPDDDYLFNRSTARDSTDYGPRPKYQTGGSTEFIAPDPIYQTAKEMNIDNSSIGNNFNISWRFNVKRGVTHLVRLHFCDIVSQTTNEFLRFNLFIYNRFGDLIRPYYRISQLGAPFHNDYVVESDGSGFMNISIGTRNDSRPLNAFLNGIEIMELVTDHSEVSVGSHSTRKRLPVIVGSAGGGVVLVFVVLVVIFFGLKKKKGKPVEAVRPPVPPGGSGCRDPDSTKSDTPLVDLNLGLKVPFSEILHATKNFDPKLMIGEGGFGKVYKGELRNGTKVAVKRSEPGHGQGILEFQTEVLVLSKIQHNHLVSLIGYCDERDEMILVYEFMEKGTLQDHLYILKGESKGSVSMSELSWVQRLGICIGAAKGIHYLHTGLGRVIIHRDIKSTNILLDEHYIAKVADFGLSRSGSSDQSYVSTDVKGSFGYLDPEYFRCLQLTQKSDVYSFGVVLLEVLCARPAIDHSLPKDQVSLADWGLSWQRKGEMDKIIDPILLGKINPDSLRKFCETVEKCLQENGSDRPNMGDVLWDLEYCLRLEDTKYDDSTTDVVPTQFVQWLPSHSIPFGEDEVSNEAYSIDSDASLVNGSEVFSQFNNRQAR